MGQRDIPVCMRQRAIPVCMGQRDIPVGMGQRDIPVGMGQRDIPVWGLLRRKEVEHEHETGVPHSCISHANLFL